MQKLDTVNLVLIVAVIFLVYLLFNCSNKSSTETYDGTHADYGRVAGFELCENCSNWNSVDVQTHCDKMCRIKYPDRPVYFTGDTTKLKQDSFMCECAYNGKMQKRYISCPNGKSLDAPGDCFIWNNEDAKQKCPLICNKYLQEKSPKWTGDWKTSTMHTGACECMYYD